MGWAEQNERAAAALAARRFTTSSGFARADCPFCVERVGKEDHKQCFSVNVTTGHYRCWRCGISGRISGYEDEGSTWTPPKASHLPPPLGYWPLYENPALSSPETVAARRYLVSRGVGADMWEAIQVGCCLTGKLAHRVIVPVLDIRRRWLGWVARSWTARSRRAYLNSPGMVIGPNVYNPGALAGDSLDPVLVMEGVFDALAHWPRAVACLGKPSEQQEQTLLAADRAIVVVLDGDAWEEGWMLALKLRMGGKRAGAVRLPPTVDPDEVSRDVLAIAAAESLESYSGVVSIPASELEASHG